MNEDEIRSEVREYYTRAARARQRRPRPRRRLGSQPLRHRHPRPSTRGSSRALHGVREPAGHDRPRPRRDRARSRLGGGLDVILSAKRVGPTGIAYGIDELDEMIDVARAHATEAGITNATFLKGLIENVPLPDASVDAVISNCVICLAPDKTPVFTEIARVLRPGGRMAVTDIVADNGYTPPDGDGAWAECGIGALQHDELLAMITSAGLVDATIEYTHDTGPGLHGATIRARRP